MKIPKNITEDIIYRLDSIARGRCNYEYGLPTIPDCEEMKEMKKAIEEILKPYLKLKKDYDTLKEKYNVLREAYSKLM